jgi:E3 ubiquitin-protein ligase MYCBP2
LVLEELSGSDKEAFKNVCREEECQEKMGKSCEKMNKCGHPCYGFRGEAKCIPCIHPDCIDKSP